MSGVLTVTNAAGAASALQQRSEAVQAFVMHHVVDAPVIPGGSAGASWTSLTFHGAMVIVCALLLALVFRFLYRKTAPVPTGITNLLEAFVVFIRDEISIRFLGEEDGRKMTPLFCSFFFFILAMNLSGLIPGIRTPTANLGVTGALALVSLGFMIFGGMYKNGVIGFFKSFAPHGVPWPLLLVLVPLEIIGLFVKSFALMIRLFANMLAGHMALFFMIGMIIILGSWGLPMLALALFVYLLEVFVALLQAYIFTLLSAVFIGERYHPQH